MLRRIRTTGFLTLLTISIVTGGHIRAVDDLPVTFYTQDGDVVIGATFPVHQYSDNSPCSTTLREFSVLQKMQAFVFAINQINSNPAILPNLTLGFAIADDCSKDVTAMARALHFVQTPSSGHVMMRGRPASEQNSTTVPPTKVTIFQAGTSTLGTSPARVGNGSDDARAGVVIEEFPSMDVVGVVGTESSPSTIRMASVLSLFHVPMLSYIATSTLLSDKEKFPYFARIVPSDSKQGQVIAAVLQRLNWTYVSVVYSAGGYGSWGMRAVREAMKFTGACLASVIEVRPDFKKEDYDKVVRQLQRTPSARAVVLFADLPTCRDIFAAVARTNNQNNFTWVASDALGCSLQDFQDFEHLAQGTITININTKTSASFDRYFQTLSANNCSNPWFREFLEASYNCSYSDSGKSNSSDSCPEDLTFGGSSYTPEDTTSLIIDAVNVFARALESQLSVCNFSSPAEMKNCVRGDALYAAILNTSFEGGNGLIRFNEDGDGETSYVIRTLALLQDGSYELRKAGEWDMRSDTLRPWSPDEITWKGELLVDDGGNPVKVPQSACSPECGTGEGAMEQPQSPHCCWVCTACHDNERTVRTFRHHLYVPTCKSCPNLADDMTFTWPDPETRTRCDPIPPANAGLIDSAGPVFPCVDLLLLLVAVTVLIIFVKNDSHHIIKTSGRPLCYVAMAGVMCSCLGVLFFTPNVTEFSCTASHVLFHMSFTVTYAPMAVRSYVIYQLGLYWQGRKRSDSTGRPRTNTRMRGQGDGDVKQRHRGRDGDGGRQGRERRRAAGSAWESNDHETHDAQGIAPVKYQGISVAFIIFLQVNIRRHFRAAQKIVWYLTPYFAFPSILVGLVTLSHVMSPEEVKTLMPNPNKRYVITTCVHRTRYPWFALSVIFNLALLVACACLGFKTRRVKTNFHETRWLNLGVFSAAITWTVVILTHFRVATPHLDSLFLSVAMMVNVVIVLSCVFGPKLYAVYFVDQVIPTCGSRDGRGRFCGKVTCSGFGMNVVVPATASVIRRLEKTASAPSQICKDEPKETRESRRFGQTDHDLFTVTSS